MTTSTNSNQGDAIETITPSSLAPELIAARPPPTEREQHLAISLSRLLAEGADIARLTNRGRYPSVLTP